MISQTFARNVRKEALSQGRHIGELETSCGVGVGYLAKSAKYGHWIPLETAERFAKALGKEIAELCEEWKT